LNPQLISSLLQFFLVWVSLVTASNENSAHFMGFLDTLVLNFPQLLYLCGVRPMFGQSEVLVAPIEEQPYIQS
jgi:hypothetical protein